MELWPNYTPAPEYKELVNIEIDRYGTGKLQVKYTPYIGSYETAGDYMNWGKHKRFQPAEGRLLLDSQGIPKIKYGTDYHYNPVTVSQYALTMHGRYMNRPKDLKKFLAAADHLISMQHPSGAFRYPFSFEYFRKVYPPGWVSGMSQGHALSVFARAYRCTGKKRYLAAGNAALQFLIKPIQEGGTMATFSDLHPSLASYIIFEEYPVQPSSYTLNGFLFTMIGLYDWWKLSPSSETSSSALAGQYFLRCVETAKQILCYYDIGGYTAYDLRHLIYGLEPKSARTYHAVHIYLLYALYSITGDKVFKNYYRMWRSYID
ncbi:D-glucuronyl C5-epimerase family protein [Paenibacillus gansuensis]|uniref:D-glucuronyl C5-epimerase family protein n=1 Tax=Paenibacillus gansuensis TaxID=306542 RepID=A0ABW5PI48_9BACL